MNRSPKYDQERAESLLVNPIGFMHTAMRAKFDAPHQPHPDRGHAGVVELVDDNLLAVGLSDLSGFSHIWLIWWFHRNNNWRPKVRPPRGPEQRRGVFATRSPHRPNPIGMTAVELLKIDGKQLFVGNHDLVDGTPILDIKPYLPEVDAITVAATGWVGEVEKRLNPINSFEIRFSDLAIQQCNWFEARGINFIDRALEILSRDPSPHKTRRIRKLPDGNLRMGCGCWRIIFWVEDQQVNIKSFAPGYPEASLKQKTDNVEILDSAAQREFYSEWLTKS